MSHNIGTVRAVGTCEHTPISRRTDRNKQLQLNDTLFPILRVYLYSMFPYIELLLPWFDDLPMMILSRSLSNN